MNSIKDDKIKILNKDSILNQWCFTQHFANDVFFYMFTDKDFSIPLAEYFMEYSLTTTEKGVTIFENFPNFFFLKENNQLFYRFYKENFVLDFLDCTDLSLQTTVLGAINYLILDSLKDFGGIYPHYWESIVSFFLNNNFSLFLKELLEKNHIFEKKRISTIYGIMDALKYWETRFNCLDIDLDAFLLFLDFLKFNDEEKNKIIRDFFKNRSFVFLINLLDERFKKEQQNQNVIV